MAKNITLDSRFTKLESLIERGFGAIASDISGVKDQVMAVHRQVNLIERQLRDMRHVKLEDRVAAGTRGIVFDDSENRGKPPGSLTVIFLVDFNRARGELNDQHRAQPAGTRDEQPIQQFVAQKC